MTTDAHRSEERELVTHDIIGAAFVCVRVGLFTNFGHAQVQPRRLIS